MESEFLRWAIVLSTESLMIYDTYCLQIACKIFFLKTLFFFLIFEFHPKLNQKQFILLNESSKQKHFDCSYSIKLYIILSRTLCMDEIMQQQLSILLSNVVIQTEFYERYIFFLFSLRFDVAKVIIQ